MGDIFLKLKRPSEATPERAVALRTAGVTPTEMARMWRISRSYIYYLLHLGGWQPKPKVAVNPPAEVPSDEKSR